MTKFKKLLCAFVFLAASAGPTAAQTVTVIDFPGADFTSAFGINEANQVVGRYFMSGVQRGFLRDGPVFTTLPIEIARDVNNVGDVATEIMYPGSVLTRVNGINDAGLMVGDRVTTGAQRCFTFDGVTMTPVVIEGAVNTDATAINNAGAIVGEFVASPAHGFLREPEKRHRRQNRDCRERGVRPRNCWATLR